MAMPRMVPVRTIVRRRQAQVRGGLQGAIKQVEDRDLKLRKLASGMTVRGLKPADTGPVKLEAAAVRRDGAPRRRYVRPGRRSTTMWT